MFGGMYTVLCLVCAFVVAKHFIVRLPDRVGIIRYDTSEGVMYA